MNPEKWIGTVTIRLVAIALVVASTGSWLLHASRELSSGLLAFSVFLSVVSFIAFVHTGRAVYDLWMKAAEGIQRFLLVVWAQRASES